MKVKITISLSTSYPIALRALPEYPGRKLGIHFESGDSVTVFSSFRKCHYVHSDGNRYEIRFFELIDGLGWIHDFDVKMPKQRTIIVHDSSESEYDADTLLLWNISSHAISIHQFPEYPGHPLPLSFEPGECAYVSSEFRKVYYIHSDSQRYCIRFYRLMDQTGWIHDFNPISPQQRNLSQEILELPLCQLRTMAKQSGFTEISHNRIDHMIAFQSDQQQLRHHVYYKTGTLVTLWFHPRVGQRYHFRQKQSMDDLRQIFLSDDVWVLHTSLDYEDTVAGGEEAALRNQITRLTEESKRIENEKAALFSRLELFDQIRAGETKRLKWKNDNIPRYSDDYDRNHKKNGSENDHDNDNNDNDNDMTHTSKDNSNLERNSDLFDNKGATEPRRNVIPRSLSSSPIHTGKSFTSPIRRYCHTNKSSGFNHQSRGDNVRCNLPDSQTEFITQNWSANVNSVAIGGESIVLIYDDFSWSSTTGLPPLLLKRLHTRPTHLPPPAYVAAGSMNRCYISFSDGSFEWNASEGFHKCIHENKNSTVSRVAFGRHWNSFAVIFENGIIQFNNIPTELETQIKKNEESPIVKISLGPNGEWFLARANGSIMWMAKCCEIATKELEGTMTDMIFGSSGTYIIRYEQH